MSKYSRSGQRSYDQLRQLRVSYDIYKYAASSALFELGNTKIMCSVTLQQSVPHFLRGKKTGWLTAEYSLLPASTPIRTVREVTANKRSGRTIEISRLIGRALRSVTRLDVLGEQTIFLDCDVLQADGGTRTACITAAYLALRAAQAKWLREGIISRDLLADELAAVSVGLASDMPILDLDFMEDSGTEADFNFVLTRSNRLIEIQGSAERYPISWNQYEEMKELAHKGVRELFEFYDQNKYEPTSEQNIGAALRMSSKYFSTLE